MKTKKQAFTKEVEAEYRRCPMPGCKWVRNAMKIVKLNVATHTATYTIRT